MAFERFGKYLLLERIASGGMAEVYLAKTIGLNNFVAIKRILPQFSQNPEFLVMFREEAQIVANLRHSNIVSIHYFGQEKGQLFLVMDFVEGQNLRQILNTLKKEGSYFGLDQITYLVREVAAGLDYAHRALDNATGKPLNIIHRDMSPQNIMVSFEGEVKIV
ncbi:MAG: serine/threonine protein kinase, partial [Bdellovibrionaceae bacterium]|nr:serine/threonine protein kinase [Pseudobdellovibrionaceae bacterium]